MPEVHAEHHECADGENSDCQFCSDSNQNCDLNR